jgi:hypothetical protein
MANNFVWVNATTLNGTLWDNGTLSSATPITQIGTLTISGSSKYLNTQLNNTGTIIENDSRLYFYDSPIMQLISLAVSPSSVAEDGTTNLVYTFTRTGVTSNALTVNYTVGGTATLGTDYTGITTTGTTKTVTFAANSSTATVTVNPTADTTVESDETVALTLATGTGYTIGTTNAVTGTIQNDDTVLAIAPANADQSEGDSGSKAFTFTINRTGYLLSAVSVDYTVEGVVLIAVVDGWESASADDFTGGVFPSGTVSFVPGETSKVIRVNVQGDTTPEVEGDFPSQDVFTVTLSNPTNGATITTANAFGTIQNDDTSVSLAVSPPSVTEDGTTNLVYTFTRTGVTSNALTVNYKVGGTATLGTDYTGITTTGTTKTVTFAANSSTATVTVNPAADTTVESDETVVLTLASGTGYTIGTTSAVTGTITNDDPFTGTSNADTLIGTNGADTLIGLAGNDTYTVNHIGDIVTEALNAGTDLVNSSISYTLPNNVENLTLTGSSNINGTGNSLNNILIGNSGNNTLAGGVGNDYINGGAGVDTLTGGVGSDIFVFQFGQSPVSAADLITDFAIGTDKIDLLTSLGVAMNAPTSFTRAANSTATTLTNVVNNVFTDANGVLTGNQALGVNRAC